MLNQMGDPNANVFIEGDSDVIDEDDEGNYSFENNPRSSAPNKRRQTIKRNKSLDDGDQLEGDEPVLNQQEFLKGLMNELNEKPSRASFKQKAPQLQEYTL